MLQSLYTQAAPNQTSENKMTGTRSNPLEDASTSQFVKSASLYTKKKQSSRKMSQGFVKQTRTKKKTEFSHITDTSRTSIKITLEQSSQFNRVFVNRRQTQRAGGEPRQEQKSAVIQHTSTLTMSNNVQFALRQSGRYGFLSGSS